ncbi:gliding motility-associated C-terminal domain-containing protein, partial [Flavobacterium hankyongi]
TNPSNCDTVISVVTVAASVIDANDDSHTMESGSNGGTAVIDVFANDTLNGSSTGLNQVTLTIDLPDPTGHIVLNPDGTVNVHLGTPAGTYQITYTICEKLNPGNCSTAVVTVIVNTIEEIDIYTHMTPNDDGNNDVFYIDGITKYPNNTVEIYNRWGVLVYQAKKYNNTDVSFDGKSRGRTTINRDDNLPEGTYYYIVRYTKDNGETKEKAGYLYINR